MYTCGRTECWNLVSSECIILQKRAQKQKLPIDLHRSRVFYMHYLYAVLMPVIA